jgi:hypothetical protein
MKCAEVQQNIALAAYQELPDNQYHALEQHLAICSQCQEEFAAVTALQRAMAWAPVAEPSANLLAQTRMRLEESLDAVPPHGWWVRAGRSVLGAMTVLGRAPATAAALLALGLGLGGWAGYRAAQRPQPQQAAAAASASDASPEVAEVADVSSITHDANSENVEVQFDRLVPQTIRGSVDDPQIRQLLVLAAQNRVDPAIQQNSVTLLADQCKTGHSCSDGPVRKALLVALLYDQSPEVRLTALNGLEPYVAEDMRVRDAVLEALMQDSDSLVRSRAIELLEPVEDDSSVREVLHTVASQDDNPHIRTVSREVLDQLPQVQ